MNNKKIAFVTLGCKINYAESSTYERDFLANGFKLVSWHEKADVYVVNTCTVTAQADKKSRNMIRKVHKTYPEAVIVVTGCYAQLKRNLISQIEGVSLIFGAERKGELVKETLKYIENKEKGIAKDNFHLLKEVVHFNDNSQKVIFEKIDSNITFPAYSSGERTRAFLKVQDGCSNFCAYCTIPFARGRSRNIPIKTVIKQAHKIAAKGIKEIVITGVNTGDFGRSTGESFLDLLKELEKVEGIERYRISSIEPNLLTDEIIDWIANESKKFLPHFHIPLQSGTNTLLESMGRKYSVEFFEDKIETIRQKMEKPGAPKVFFGIDVIVGLPGETDELFQSTYDVLKNKIKPAFIHIFPYSQRAGTRACRMPGQIDPETKKARVAKLEELCDNLHADFVKQNAGIHEQVLFEEADKNGMMSGYTGNYIKIDREYDEKLTNTIVDVIL